MQNPGSCFNHPFPFGPHPKRHPPQCQVRLGTLFSMGCSQGGLPRKLQLLLEPVGWWAISICHILSSNILFPLSVGNPLALGCSEEPSWMLREDKGLGLSSYEQDRPWVVMLQQPSCLIYTVEFTLQPTWYVLNLNSCFPSVFIYSSLRPMYFYYVHVHIGNCEGSVVVSEWKGEVHGFFCSPTHKHTG